MSYISSYDAWWKKLPKKEILMAETSKSCDLPKKKIFDGLHKWSKNAFGGVFPKKEIPFWKILMAYISKSCDWKKVDVGYVSRPCDFLKKKNFDGLHKCFKNAFGRVFPKKEIPF